MTTVLHLHTSIPGISSVSIIYPILGINHQNLSRHVDFILLVISVATLHTLGLLCYIQYARHLQHSTREATQHIGLYCQTLGWSSQNLVAQSQNCLSSPYRPCNSADKHAA